MRDDGGGGAYGTGEDLLPIGAHLGGHAAVAERLVAEGEQRIEWRLFESGLPVIGGPASFVEIDPFAIGRRPSGAKEHMAMRDVQQVAGAKIPGIWEESAEGRKLRGLTQARPVSNSVASR